MDEHKKYLSDRLLSEELPVTYRLLSRALDVHVNTAKEILYDFHKYQNALRANSVHATYLVYGTKTEDAPEAGDTEMGGSVPEPEALSEYAPMKTITIVTEENLKGILAEYQHVSSVHVYSLAPHPQRDLTLLSDVSKSLSEYTKGDDVGVASKKYGTIPNPYARKKDRKSRAPVPMPNAPKPIKPEPIVTATKATQAAKVKQEAAETPAPSNDAAPSSSSGKKPAPSSKRGGAGGIMQSFAKAAAKPPKPKPVAKKEEENTTTLSDDGEADDSDMPLAKKSSIDTEALKKSRKERKEALRRMMDDFDQEEEEAEDKDDEPADEEMEEAPEPEPEPEPESETTEEKEPAEVVSSSGNGRRRGKRRVMKKKRILDDQGYMVTIQEAAWESFSEDEAPPRSSKPAPASTPVSSAPKPKKAAGKGAGQGNIMSFFSKK